MPKCTRLRFISHWASMLLIGYSLNAVADSLEDATQSFKQGQYDQALDQTNRVLAGRPKDAQARFLKGLILTQQDKTDEAIKEFSTLTADYPDLPEPYNNLAVLYANRGQYDKAKESLEMAIRTNPSYATAHENLGDIYARMASQAYDRALKLGRNDQNTQTKLSMVQGLFTGANNPALPSSISAPSPVAQQNKPVVPPSSIKTDIAPRVVTATAPQNQEVLKVLHDWAAAWSAKDTHKYLSFYAPDFTPPSGESRAKWEAARAEKIGKPKSIHVGISNAKVTLENNDHATLSFRQTYSASHLKIASNKLLKMEKLNGRWLIQQERIQ